MITLYRFMPAPWGLPCVSPFVTKVASFLALSRLDFQFQEQPLDRLETDAPHRTLPYIIDGDTVVSDSELILDYCQATYGDRLDAELDSRTAAEQVAWSRLLDDHLYWCGIVYPRWHQDTGWETYVPILAGGKPPPDVRAALDGLRARTVSKFAAHGVGRLNDQEMASMFGKDLVAITQRLGDQSFLLGETPHRVDAGLYAYLAHIMTSPFVWDGQRLALENKTLTQYVARMAGAIRGQTNTVC